MYIYADILIITNIYSNFFLLKAVSKLTHNTVKNGKCVLSAVVGSFFSLVILLPELNTVALLMIRILSAAAMVIVAFSGRTLRELYKIGLIFFFISFLFAGTEYAFSILDSTNNIVFHNSVLYVNISILTLVISTAAAYAALSFFRRIIDKSNEFDNDYSVIIINGEKQITLKAVCDSCNNLVDSFTGKPVIICSKRSVENLFKEKELVSAATSGKISSGKWRLIPFSTIDSSGLIPSFRPTGIYIKNNENGKIKYTDGYIGIVDRELEFAILNPKIF